MEGVGTFQLCVRCLYSGVSGRIKATEVVIVSTGTFPIELRLMYESRPLLATGVKYRKLSFMLSEAILSGHSRFMSLSGAMGVYQVYYCMTTERQKIQKHLMFAFLNSSIGACLTHITN